MYNTVSFHTWVSAPAFSHAFKGLLWSPQTLFLPRFTAACCMECGAYYWIFWLICRNAVLYVVLGSRKIVPKNLPPLELWQPTPVFLPEKSHGQDSPWVPRVGQDLMTKPWSCTQTVTLSANKISFISFVLSYLIKKFGGWGLCWIFFAALRLSRGVLSGLLISITSVVAEQGFSSCSSYKVWSQ